MPKPSRIEVRPWTESDSVQQITALLHRSYARNATAGLRFLATHQDESVTLDRLRSGPSFVATIEGQIVGTIMAYLPQSQPYGDYAPGHKIASFGQLAVDPSYQGEGIGEELIATVERLARESGCRELGLDTAHGAVNLIAYYRRLGFEIVGRADWRPTTNYEGWIMVKSLRDEALEESSSEDS